MSASREAYEYELLAPPPVIAIPLKDDNTHTVTPIQPKDHLISAPPSPVSATQDEQLHPSSGRTWPKSALASHSKTQDKGEPPTVALKRSPGSLALSFVIHFIPVIITAAIVQLSFRSIFWFDVEDTTSNQIRISRWAIRLNEFLNILQFLAKIHELLLVASLSAIVLHFVQVFLVGSTGLPLGLLTAGYAFDSPKYILTKAFWGSALNRTFCLFCGLLVIGTVLANVVGPASAIVLIPNLDWWPVQDPYSGQKLPVVFFHNTSSLWPTSLTSLDAQLVNTDLYTPDACATSEASQTLDLCPASGFDALSAFSAAYSSEGVAANITMIDKRSGSKRVVNSRLTARQGTRPAVAISTSLSRNLAVAMSSFWLYLEARSIGVIQMARPKLTISKNTPSFQPLVQVQCIPYLLPGNTNLVKGPMPSSINVLNGTSVMVDSSDLNVFSESGNLMNHSWPIPDWLHSYRYIPKSTSFGANSSIVITAEAVDLIWVDTFDHESTSASIGAIVVAPFIRQVDDTRPDSLVQFAFAHACTINARWIASTPSYDPIVNSEIQHNITDPLIFEKKIRHLATASAYGIGPTVGINSSWASLLNVPFTMEQSIAPTKYSNATLVSTTAGTFQWLTDKFLFADNPGTNQSYIVVEFEPGYNFGQNISGLDTMSDYSKAVSETLATILSMLVTDGLARLSSQEGPGVELPSTGGNLTYVNLLGLEGQSYFQSVYNDTAAAFAEYFPYAVLIDVDRYGYGYGTQSRTVQFGIAVLFLQALVTFLYLGYVTFNFFRRGGWVSGAWSEMSELVVMMANPFNTNEDKSKGVESSGDEFSALPMSTQRVRIREVDNDHLGVTIGEDYDQLELVQPGKKYEGARLRFRRKSF